MRRPTLLERKYGEGYRDTPHRKAVAPWHGCGVEGCGDPTYGSIEMYVDDVPPMMDWYSRILAKLPAGVWTTVGFCDAHLSEVVQRSVYELLEEPDLWAPGRSSPPVLTHPPKVTGAEV
jgi:hypothetical protein